MLMVAPISISYASVRVFSRGVLVLSSPVLPLCPHSRFATLGRGGSGEFRGDYCFLPVIRWVKFSLSAVASPFLCWGGGGRERKLLSIIIMHSCNPNDRLDHILINSFHL